MPPAQRPRPRLAGLPAAAAAAVAAALAALVPAMVSAVAAVPCDGLYNPHAAATGLSLLDAGVAVGYMTAALLREVWAVGLSATQAAATVSALAAVTSAWLYNHRVAAASTCLLVYGVVVGDTTAALPPPVAAAGLDAACLVVVANLGDVHPREPPARLRFSLAGGTRR